MIGSNQPLGKVLFGSGNDGESGYEGVRYKNVIGTYIHGPLLPKNPMLCDWLLARALEEKIRGQRRDDAPWRTGRRRRPTPIYAGGF